MRTGKAEDGRRRLYGGRRRSDRQPPPRDRRVSRRPGNEAVVARMKALREKMRLPALELRVGLHSGPVMSGVVGKHKFTFDIWGDSVNTAALMEANGAPGRINVSESVAGHVKKLFEMEPRGPLAAKQ